MTVPANLIAPMIWTRIKSFPKLDAVVSGNETVTTTSHVIPLPTAIPGKKITVAIEFTSASTITIPPGWTVVYNTSNRAFIWKMSDGSETSVTITTSAAVIAAYVAGRWTNAGLIVSSTEATGSASVSDPPNFNPGAGVKKFTWIAYGSMTLQLTGAPTGYGNFYGPYYISGPTRACMGFATKDVEASSEDPGVFSASGTSTWQARTIAVYPEY